MLSLEAKAVWETSKDPFENALGRCLLARRDIYMAQKLMETVDAAVLAADLEYFAIGTTAMGALRHGGQVPWCPVLEIGMLSKHGRALLKSFPARDIFTKAGVALVSNADLTEVSLVLIETHAEFRCNVTLCDYQPGTCEEYMNIGNVCFKTADVFPIRRAAWCGSLWINVPCQAESLMEATFGPHWFAPVSLEQGDATLPTLATATHGPGDKEKELEYVRQLVALRVPNISPGTYWPAAYASSRASFQVSSPSPFAAWLLDNGTEGGGHQFRVRPGLKVVDVGCGNMRDSVAFATAGCQVLGIDPYAPDGPPIPNLTIVRHAVERLDDSVHHAAFASADVVYMRWFAHAIPYATFEAVIARVSSTVADTCILALEARATHDTAPTLADLPTASSEHFRNPLNVQALWQLLTAAPNRWVITHLVYGRGLATCEACPDAHSKDPVVVRIIAKRRVE